jgi:hypothetical protein
MRGRLTRILVPAAALAVTLALSAAGALATTWSISPAGKFTASPNKGTTILFTDVRSGTPFFCPAGTTKGDVPKAGHGLSGNGIATISRNTWGTSAHKCTGPAGTTCTAVSINTPWKFTPISYSAKVDGGQTTGVITASGTGTSFKISCIVLGAVCSMTTGGSKSAPARASFLYDNNPHLLAITSVSHLKLTKSNCPTYNVGDGATFITNPASKAGKAVSHGYSVSSKIHLTSP